MPIHITRRAEWRDRREGIDKQEHDVLWVAYPKASYTVKKQAPASYAGQSNYCYASIPE